MEQDPTSSAGKRPGGRSGRVREAVLDAVIELLASASFDDLRVEDVAVRAGVNKTTIYRRWPTKADLVEAATRARSESTVPVPDTGTLEGDLGQFACAVARNVGSELGGRMTRTMVAASVTSGDVAARGYAFWSDRLEAAGAIIDRAIARGDLPQGVDTNLVIETLVGALYVRLLLTGEPINAAIAQGVASLVASGTRSAPPLTVDRAAQ